MQAFSGGPRHLLRAEHTETPGEDEEHELEIAPGALAGLSDRVGLAHPSGTFGGGGHGAAEAEGAGAGVGVGIGGQYAGRGSDTHARSRRPATSAGHRMEKIVDRSVIGPLPAAG